MSAIIPVVETSGIHQILSVMRSFRIIPRIEKYPAVVAFVQTVIGKVVLLALFGLGLRYFYRVFAVELLLMMAIAIVTFLPEQRRFVLALTPILLMCMGASRDLLRLGITLTVIALGMVLYVCVMRWPNSRLGRRPVVHMLSGFSVLIAMACLAPVHSLARSVLWNVVGVVASYVWFICYALTDRVSQPKKDTTLELTAFRPLWGSTNTPYPKGAAYLRRIEARNPEQLAMTQLKGLKLLTWAILLSLLANGWNWLFHSYLLIPTSSVAFEMSVRGTPVAWHLRWESLILNFFEDILEVSCYGHMVIAICRMAGFNALRNTYRPLASTTIAEFFNRYYYYYKELVVEFFFYPAFFRYWKRRPKLRLIFATFSAACFGNVFYHFTRDWPIIRDSGFWTALSNYQVFAFYCASLATMLSISQLRNKRTRPSGIVRGQVLPAMRVCFFFCVLNVFGWSAQKFPLIAHFKYLASLFFIHF